MSIQQHQFVGWAQTWHDEVSSRRRMGAIRSFGKAMIHPIKWKQSWDDGGGTAGILYLLSSASTMEVKAFCDVIRLSNRRGKKSSEREKVVEELLMALLPQHYPSTELRTHDKRPLEKIYSRMLRGCSSNFVERVLDAQDASNPLFQHVELQKLLVAHENMLKRRLTNRLIHEGSQLSQPEIDVCFKEFVSREPPLPGSQPNMSASMQYALELLQARITVKCTAERWPRNTPELGVLMSIYDRLKRRSRSADKTFLIKLGLQLIELKPDLNRSSHAGVLWSAILALWKKDARQYEDLLVQGMRLELLRSRTVLPIIVTRWKENSDQYEHLLVEALRHGLGGSAKEINYNYLDIIKDVPRAELSAELRWRLLRLYCQHVPQSGIDVETTSDFKCISNQGWSFEVFEKLGKDHASLFLHRLYAANPNYSFLQAPTHYNSIYALRTAPRPNFNVELLLTVYNRGDSNTQQRALQEVDQLRKKAATAREQEDRALFARAAAHYAIATGDLETYAETILWQQRFIRDPLTAQEIFKRKNILTSEGVALLSGISLSPTEDMTLSTIERELAVANRTLERFNEARQLAKKEPSYNRSNWTMLSSLYADVYKERVSRAKKVKLQPHESGLEMFRIIWRGTTDLVHTIGAGFLREVDRSILDLLDAYSGLSLIAASEMLLDFAAQLRKKQDRNEDQDEVSGCMDGLTYRVISKLASSDTPLFAQDLIRRAIIEYPEASSWHRQFLSIRYMRNLPAEAAKNMLMSFAAAVGEKLEEQSYVRVGDEEPPKNAPPKSLIKVTTAKYLAQILNDADFISLETAVDVLTELFKSATHIDVRLAIVDSLLGTLNAISGNNSENWRSNPMVEKILNTLDSVVPIAGNLNERRPVDAIDWAEAKDNGTLPAPYELGGIPPLFQLLLDVVSGRQFPGLKELRGEMFSRLVLPTLHHSQEQHSEWFSLFLAKYKPTLDPDSLPRIPITPDIWYRLLDHQGQFLPSTTINEFNQYLILQLRFPRNIQELNKALRDNTTLRSDTNVAQWLSIFDQPNRLSSWKDGIDRLVSLIVAPIEKVSPTADLLGAVVSQAAVLLDDYESHMEQWSYLVAALGPASIKSLDLSKQESKTYDEHMKKAWTYWRESVPPLAQRLIALIEQKRAPSADRDVDVLLPSTFPLRLLCLPYLDPRVRQQDRYFRHLAKTLDQTLISFFKSDEGNPLLWTTFADTTNKTLASIYRIMTHRLCIAVHVGDLDLDADETATIPAVRLIKVAVAIEFIDGANKCGSLRKPKLEKDLTLQKVRVGELVKRLRVVMERWGQRGVPAEQVPFRDNFLRWKGKNIALWDDICSWDETYEEGAQSS
ncbi:hypothetical protein F4777DRAFT_360662 [Nemania sp. FL0916]|nr:hypothetical protein F4777DRAFT_360662 [Nemania sp. FL0916]